MDWTPEGYLKIIEADMVHLNEEVDSFSELEDNAAKRCRFMAISRFAMKVAENAHRAFNLCGVIDPSKKEVV